MSNRSIRQTSRLRIGWPDQRWDLRPDFVRAVRNRCVSFLPARLLTPSALRDRAYVYERCRVFATRRRRTFTYMSDTVVQLKLLAVYR